MLQSSVGRNLQSIAAKFSRIRKDNRMTYLYPMYERKLPVELSCGLHLFMEVMNGKWKIDLIWCIHSGINRPADLHRKISKASRRLLDTQLKQLVQQNILTKKVYEQRTQKVEYGLTELGKTLIPVIEVAATWGETHREVLEPLFANNQELS